MPAVECPTCQKPLRVPEESAGQTAKCPHCNQAFVVPSAQPEESDPNLLPPAPAGGRAPANSTPPADDASIAVCVGRQSRLRLPPHFRPARSGARTAVPSMPAYGGMVPDRATLEGVTVPLLVSAISNVVFALLWAFSCWGIVFAVPLIILCIFEFMLYSNATQIDRRELGSRAQVLAIFELIVGLLNIVSLVCGIIILVNCPKLNQARV